jgi:single-stranded-DNA-specific exonuclease
MGDTKLALDLLRAENDEQALTLAKRLIQLNQKRRERTAINQEIVERRLRENPGKADAPILFCFDPALEPGVSGIVATRLVERYGKPVVYINPDGGQGRGSARGPDGVNVLEMLSCASDLFTQYGGHTEACGFSIPFENIPLLESRLIESATNRPFHRVEGCERVEHHMGFDAKRICWRMYDELKGFEPFGAGNPEPQILLEGIRIAEIKTLSEGKHLRFRAAGTPDYVEFILWNVSQAQLSLLEHRQALFRATGGFEKSFFGRSVTLRFRVEELSVESPVF